MDRYSVPTILQLVLLSLAIPAVAQTAAVQQPAVLPSAAQQLPVQEWLTTQDGSSLLKQQTSIAWQPVSSATGDAIRVDDSTRYQRIAGFGQALTGGSAVLLMKMSATARHALLQELFGDGPADIHMTYLRISVGSSDMNAYAFTYDDTPGGESDAKLQHFSLGPDAVTVVPVLQEILRIQPGISIMASPWSAPEWMKDNQSLKGGSLKRPYYATYAQYLVRYLETMQQYGIHITSLTPQNEPENANNLPSMLFSSSDEAAFIGEYLGPALAKAGVHTAIFAYDHNCDDPGYAEAVLRDRKAAPYVAGSAFHLYEGTTAALSKVHDAFPQKAIYLTEQMVIPDAHHPDDHSIARPESRVVIGALRNWSSAVMLWNLAADPQAGPHTGNGGCPVCVGALTLAGNSVTRRTAYYTVAQVSKFVPPGSFRVSSLRVSSLRSDSAQEQDTLASVAFITPQGGHVVIVSDTGAAARLVTILSGGQQMQSELAGMAVATFVW
jgi:glucosylceramidase